MRQGTTVTIHETSARRGRVSLVAVIGLSTGALSSAFLGYVYGPWVAGGLAHAWSEWLFPAFMTVYIAGVSLCG